MAKKATKKSPAKVTDPVAWLTMKLGKADAASFLKGLQKAGKDIAAGKTPTVEVEGQAPCGTYCASACQPGTPINCGAFSSYFRTV
jgi:hypothetical protein